MKDIRLYLGGEQVEWSKVPDILLTYQRTDYNNPTVTKNMYSKTVTIEGTQNNNNLFDHIWKLDRIQDSVLFNPSQRVEFELYNDDDIVEKGYAKLDSVKRNGYKLEYNITLFGGLGSFFYSLAYNADTDKEKTLADLNFRGSANPDDEFDFEINKESVKDAWDRLGMNPNTPVTGSTTGSTQRGGIDKKWDYINFIPCYNGYPEDFDSDKVLINTAELNGLRVRYTDGNNVVNAAFPSTITDGDKIYSPKNGYVYASMTRQCDEWEMRDLRSYLQRPAFSIKGFFEAISDPINNGGYNVSLDPTFFNRSNPYYNKAWVTLPMLNPEGMAEDDIIDWDWYKGDSYSARTDEGKKLLHKAKILSVNTIDGTPNTYSMDIELHTTMTGWTGDTLYMSTYYQYTETLQTGIQVLHENYLLNGLVMQLYGYANGSGNWYDQSGRCGSNVIVLTSTVGNTRMNRSMAEGATIPYKQADIVFNFGYWKRTTGDDFVWHNETNDTDVIHITMDTNLMSEIPNIALSMSSIEVLKPSNGTWWYQKNYNGCTFEQNAYFSNPFSGGGNPPVHRYYYYERPVKLDGKIIYRNYGNMRSYKPVKKRDLFGGLEGTPCDWLLSYCKLFGLFIEKDKLSDTIYIKLRNNWYQDETVDLDKLIDRSKAIDITPLTFESKWYNFNYGEAEGKFLDRYKNTYSQDFGKQIIDTNYNFDADEIDLIEDTSFRNGLTALEKSNYFNTKTDMNDNQIMQCLFNWCTAKYYNDQDSLETYICLPQQYNEEYLNENMPLQWYDVIPKLQMKNQEGSPTDGDGVLVFFNGIKNTGNADYWISDDVDEMFMESENPCWLQTKGEWNLMNTEQIALHVFSLPEFNRYIIHNSLNVNNLITATWDFGHTKELYVPYYRYDADKTPTIYDNFWKSYIQDLFSVNTRKVDCYVALDSNNVNDFMKRFYWWDNCLWVCTKVQDFDIAVDRSTLCSFTKVNSKNAYLETPTFDDYFLNFYRSDGNKKIPAQGTDEERSFYMTLDSSSNWIVFETGLGFATIDPNYPFSGAFGTGYVIKATFSSNKSPNERTATFLAQNADGLQVRITIKQEGYVRPKYLTVTPAGTVLPKVVTNPVNAVVSSSANWSCTNNEWSVISPTSGTSGETNITVSALTNDGNLRTTQIPFTNLDGKNYTFSIKQKGDATVTLEQNEIVPKKAMPASGGNVFYKLVNEVECTIEPMGNTANFCIASGLVSYSTTIQPSTGNGTNFWFHFNPNTTHVSRNAGFYAYYIYEGGRYTVYPTIVPIPIPQAASGNNIVHLSSSSATTATTLGANLPWEAYTSAIWITINTPSGTSANHSVSYTVQANAGSQRTGYIYISYTDEMGYTCEEIIEVVQNGQTALSVEPQVINTRARGGDYILNVDSPSAYTITTSNNWVSTEKFRDGVVSVHIEPNDSYVRTSNIVISDGNDSVTVVVNQTTDYSEDYTLDFAPEDIVFDAEGGVIEIKIRSNSPWTITENNREENEE